ncbi:g6485 [Coccomyxa elongata]
MSSRAPKFLPPAALQAEVQRTDKLRSSCQTALQKAQEVCDSAQNKLTAALSRLEATKLLLETLREDKAAVQLDADILEHLVKTLTASHARKEADIERLADELKRGEEELLAGEKEVEKCRGVEELAKSSLADTEGKLKKAQQEYEKTYARANPAPEVVPKGESATEKDKKDREKEKEKEKDSRSNLRKKKRSPSPRKDAKSRRTPRRSPSPIRSSKRSRRQSRSRSWDRRRRRSRSRSKSADRKRRKSPAPRKASAKHTGDNVATKKAGKDKTKADKPEQAKATDAARKGPEEKGGAAVADSKPSEVDQAEKRNGVSLGDDEKASQDTPVRASPVSAATAGAADALPNGEAAGTAKGEEDKDAGAEDVQAKKENGHISNDKAAESSSDGDSSASSSRHNRSPSVKSTPKRSRRSVSSGPSSGSPPPRRARGRRGSSRSLSASPRRRRLGSPRRRASGSPRRRGRSDTPVRRRRSASRWRSFSRSRSRIRVRSPPRLEKIDAYTMDLFKTSLRKCLEHHLVPFNISLINDIMRKEDRSWNIRSLNTTFLTFMKKLEDEGYVDLATRGSTTMVAGSARYKDIIEATTERLRQSRLDRRTRSRSRLRSPPSGRRRSRSPLRGRRSASRGRTRTPVRHRRSQSPRRRRSGSPGRGGERWALGGGGERWEMT